MSCSSWRRRLCVPCYWYYKGLSAQQQQHQQHQQQQTSQYHRAIRWHYCETRRHCWTRTSVTACLGTTRTAKTRTTQAASSIKDSFLHLPPFLNQLLCDRPRSTTRFCSTLYHQKARTRMDYPNNSTSNPDDDGCHHHDNHLQDDSKNTTNSTSANHAQPVVNGAPQLPHQQQHQQQQQQQQQLEEQEQYYKTILEGSVQMSYPSDQDSVVFYNPVQVQNRDLSILVLTVWSEEQQQLQKEQEQQRKQKQQQRKQQQQGPVDQLPQNDVEDNMGLVVSTNNVPSDSDPLSSSSSSSLGWKILDALAASGLRSLRYWKEIRGIRHITINDLDSAAVDRALVNIQRNGLSHVLLNPIENTSNSTENKRQLQASSRSYGIQVQQGDAMEVLYRSRRKALPVVGENNNNNISTTKHQQHQSHQKEMEQSQWDVIDLDPYGSAAPFIDGAVQAVRHGGLLCITCTDMVALGGSHPETCYGRYSSMPIPRAGYLQEMALRILLHLVASTAARYGRTIHPLISVGMDFYIRVFVQVHDDKAGVSRQSLQTGYVYQSTQSPSFLIAPCGQMSGTKGTVYQPGRAPSPTLDELGNFKIGGPIWIGPLHDTDFLEKAIHKLDQRNPLGVGPTTTSSSSNQSSSYALPWISTRDRLRGLLSSCQEELADAPLYYKYSDLAQTLHISSPPHIQVKSALINAGYHVSGYHKEPQALKTDAPNHVIWDIYRTWCKDHPPSRAHAEGSTAAKILAIKPSISVDFSKSELVEIALKNSGKRKGAPRFPKNPQPRWGPMAKASGNKRKAGGDEA